MTKCKYRASMSCSCENVFALMVLYTSLLERAQEEERASHFPVFKVSTCIFKVFENGFDTDPPVAIGLKVGGSNPHVCRT